MKIDGWKYYVHSALPSTPPHIKKDITPIKNGNIWKLDGKPLLAMWISDWDMKEESEWWYVIKDTPFNINELKKKRRYEINKGNRNFIVKEINPDEFHDSMYEVTLSAYQSYQSSQRSKIDYDFFIKWLNISNFDKVYGAFFKEDNKLYGYAGLYINCDFIDFAVLKVEQKKEKYAINAAIINKILNDYDTFLLDGGYICDGSRSVYHKTAFQNYLEKYFGFRKAYCKLHIKYKPTVKYLVYLIYPLRSLIKNTNIEKLQQLKSLLKIEEIKRSFIKRT